MRSFAVIYLFVLFMWPGALPAAESLHLRGTWYFSWSGIPFAKLWLDQQEADGHYQLVASFKSRGVLRIFKSMKTLSQSKGLVSDSGVQTLSFNYRNETEDKITNLAFDETGALLSREVRPEDDPHHRPPVSAADAAKTVTPGSALLAMRHGVKQALANGTSAFAVNFYEGKRLMRVHATIGKERDYEIEGKHYTVRPLNLRRELLNGFTDKEKKRYAEGEPPATLFLNVDGFFPLALEVEVKLGLMKAYWVAE